MIRIIIVIIAMLFLIQAAAADSTGIDAGPVSSEIITARMNITYVPINTIDFTNSNSTYEVYDNILYRLAVDYHISSLIAVGPALEYMKRKIKPNVTFERDLTGWGIMVDSKLKHNFVESGTSKMTFGFGIGVLNLKEATGQSGSGTLFYGATGLDIGLWKDLGFDFIYRYQLSRVKVEYREYNYDGSAIQMGFNYRIGL